MGVNDASSRRGGNTAQGEGEKPVTSDGFFGFIEFIALLGFVEFVGFLGVQEGYQPLAIS
jgi:hypothetical protein